MRRFRNRLHVVYGLGHFGKSLLWNLSALYFAFYLTEVAGIATRAMGWVMAVSLAFNALCDLMTGRWLSRFVHDASTAARLQFKGSALAGAAFVLFAMTGFLPIELRIGFSLLSLLLFRFGYSLMDVPQNSFMAFVSATDRERAALAGTRYIAAGLSVFVITVAITPLVRMPDRDGQAQVFFILAIIVSLLAVIGGGLLHLVFRDGRPAHAPTLRSVPDSPARARHIRTAGIFPLLLTCILCFSGLASFFSKLESYLTAYAFRTPLTASLFMPTIALGQVLSQFVWTRVVARLGLPRTSMVACAGWLLSTAALWLAIRHLPVAIILGAFAYSAMAAGVLMSVWSLLAQSCADAPRRTAWRYGLFTCCSKTAQAVAILIIGEWLSRLDYRGAGGSANPLVEIGMLGPALAAILIGMVAFMIEKTGVRQTAFAG